LYQKGAKIATIAFVASTVDSWNVLSEKLEFSADAFITWPPLLAFLQERFSNPSGLRILDFGCGTGGFCGALADRGFSVTGIDYAPKMIQIAKKISDKSINFVVGDHLALAGLESFQVITSIMTLPFIAEISEVMAAFVSSLKDYGVLLFVTYNPAWVAACEEKKILFDHGKIFYGEDLEIPVFIRPAVEYDRLASQLGLSKELEVYPPFTKEYLEKYVVTIPTDIPEYLILGYTKLLR
jgi:SAM-dependent methyltransferase